jgi:molecular chaperone GrpE
MDEDTQQPIEDIVADTVAPDPLVECQRERDKFESGWQRAVADYQNLQKEVERQKSEWSVWSKRQIIEDFLPVYTNFKTAFSHQPQGLDNKNWNNWASGIGFIMKQFNDILKSHGVEEIKTVGEILDTTRHEAVGEEASDAPEHTIIREVETGYTMGGKVIKVAKVIVVKQDSQVT